ncbi:riboflavin kinase [Devosia sp.]|uniref:riboflavin kinase n=1 Tax=Devosia sp. TaxID=1871048 RepID=UPI001B29384D|nr:riboflavin kinase [Devosia sp.]MBO9590987.1 riboflavin kinase [Devosia sp.]
MGFPGHPDSIPEALGIRLSGCVIHGDKRGRKLGFPTANLLVPAGAELPPDGVYSCLVWLTGEDAHLGATASVGNNPTFDDVRERRVEIYIHDFDRTLYGQEIKICLVARLRDMRRFSGLDDLIGQTERDVAQSRAMLERYALIGPRP